MKECPRCDGCRWVCEAHPDRPWLGVRACNCGTPGDPCPICNPPVENLPAMPDGFVPDDEPQMHRPTRLTVIKGGREEED